MTQDMSYEKPKDKTENWQEFDPFKNPPKLMLV